MKVSLHWIFVCFLVSCAEEASSRHLLEDFICLATLHLIIFKFAFRLSTRQLGVDHEIALEKAALARDYSQYKATKAAHSPIPETVLHWDPRLWPSFSHGNLSGLSRHQGIGRWFLLVWAALSVPQAAFPVVSGLCVIHSSEASRLEGRLSSFTLAVPLLVTIFTSCTCFFVWAQ